MFCSTSWRVEPVEMHPGKSGESAEKPVEVGSTTIRYFFISVAPAFARRSGFRVPAHRRLSCDRNQAGLGRMFLLSMAAPGSGKIPAVLFEHADNVADLHAG
jgi:hypothetical protein